MPDNFTDRQLAILIDADNAPRSALKEIMEEAATYGTVVIKRIYGDWTTPNMETWKPLLLQNAITPVQQYAYTTGKNATDSAMIIDAMDILYTRGMDGFVLVSSDSDFTRLATRLRESGMVVYGMGEKKTPAAFTAACDKFVYIEAITGKADELADGDEEESAARPVAKQGNRVGRETTKLIARCIAEVADDDGWARLSDLGNQLLKRKPNFDSRNFGYCKLSAMMRDIDRFEMARQSGEPAVRDTRA